MNLLYSNALQTQLSICIFLKSDALAPLLAQSLSSDRYSIKQFQSVEAFLSFVDREKGRIDCLMLEDKDPLPLLIEQLKHQGILLPAVIFRQVSEPTHSCWPSNSSDKLDEVSTAIVTSSDPGNQPEDEFLYHPAEILLGTSQLHQITRHINQAIVSFLDLAPSCPLPAPASSINLIADDLTANDLTADQTAKNFLLQQQQRLAEKLKERLGYLGVYYKRNSANFFRNLAWTEKQELLAILQKEYRVIILSYFSEDNNLNEKIDKFVNLAFFSDLPVTQIVEIHMKLMDEFSTQLKLEGRSEEILLDYRLTLIDLIAHLCEMYRRSIPRES